MGVITKLEKISKNRLTKEDKRDIINEFPAKKGTSYRSSSKNFFKKFEKTIDKRKKM